MEPASPSRDMTVETVLRAWPATIQAFLALRLACVGCPMARFCTLSDVERVYQLPSAGLIEATRASSRERMDVGGPDCDT